MIKHFVERKRAGLCETIVVLPRENEKNLIKHRITHKYDEIGQEHAVLNGGSTPLVFGTEPHFEFL
jgi:hypothetical protein